MKKTWIINAIFVICIACENKRILTSEDFDLEISNATLQPDYANCSFNEIALLDDFNYRLLKLTLQNSKVKEIHLEIYDTIVYAHYAMFYKNIGVDTPLHYRPTKEKRKSIIITKQQDFSFYLFYRYKIQFTPEQKPYLLDSAYYNIKYSIVEDSNLKEKNMLLKVYFKNDEVIVLSKLDKW